MLSVKRNFVRLAALALSVRASTLWSGSFSYYNTSSDFDKWSWSNEVGEYQWYIHGSGATSEYLNLDPSYKNPASTETHGLKLTIDNTAFWNGQTMQRTEIIPQTTANLGTGQTYYHFSLSPGAHYPDTTVEHQILFFESHFVQLKLGVSPTPTSLQFFAGSNAVWSTTFVTGTWYNFAYDINFSTGVVGLWASTGSNPLTNVVSGITGTGPSTNSEDFHVGVLAFGSATEDWLISGVYIESGTITTSIGSGTSTGTTTTVTSKSSTTTTTTSKSSTSTSTSKATTTTSTSTVKTTTTSTTTSSAAGATQTIYGQCGGIGYTGPTSCATGSTCTYSNAYYSQCLP
ncbi:hypothetical protein DL93DRAFT_264081 [Clavulina sp. PMI_390]|nr:hypothetical protein DL93DRAFT_264081 [Clavulina sp. PMI_390]